MIGSLRGIVELRNDPYLLVDVSGVGYKVLACSEVLSKLSGVGESIKLFTYTHVKDDALELYGFSHFEDLKLFEMLISVSGVGPKTAMGIFSFGKRDEIINAIIKADTEFFTGIPRLGKKNAQKIIIELKGRLGSVNALDLSDEQNSSEVVTALQNFGFSAKEAQEALRAIKDKGETTEEKVRLALKYLGK